MLRYFAQISTLAAHLVVPVRLQLRMFWVAALLMVVLQTMLVLLPIAERSLPVELDDSLVYVFKAAQIDGCFMQDCAGLNDIKAQLRVDEGSNVDWTRFVSARSFLHVYHIGHAVTLAAIQELGFSWEDAFDVTRVLGSMLILGGLAYWAWAFFGTGPGAVLLILVAFSLFPEQGLHIVTPSNTSAGIALLLFGLIARRAKGLEWLLFAGTIFMLSWHSFGVVLASMVWAFYLLADCRFRERRALFFAAVAGVLIILAFVLQNGIHTPMLAMPFHFRPEGWEGITGYKNNALKAFAIVVRWLNEFGGALLAVPMLAMGAAVAEPSRRHVQRVLITLVAVLLVVSLLMVFAPHAALLFRRLWVFGSLLGLGLVAQAIWFGASVLIIRFRHGTVSDPLVWADFVRGKGFVVVGVLTVAAMLFAVAYSITGAAAIQREIVGRIARHEYDLSVAQVDRLLSVADSYERVLYVPHEQNRSLNAVPALFYFIHGAMDRGAVLDILLNDPESRAEWLARDKCVNYLVAWTPLMKFGNARRSGLVLEPGGVLRFQSDAGFAAADVLLRFAPEAVVGDVEVESLGANGRIARHQVPVRAGWLAPFADSNAQLVELALRVSHPVDLTGLRIGRDTNLRWPWGQGVRVVREPKGGQAEEVAFMSGRGLLPDRGCEPVILDDQGGTTLADIRDCNLVVH